MSMANEASLSHVFLSFKGELRNKFICFLYKALKAEGFVAFMDNNNICVGDGVDTTIKDGIKNSMSAIIIFSQNYAYSTWCLEELVLILERNKNSRYFIIPILYDVGIEDIKHQLGNYGLALEHHRERNGDKVRKWREALVEVGNILGHQVEGPQDTFIQNTVKLFGERLVMKFPDWRLPMPKSLVSEGSSFSSLSSQKPKESSPAILTAKELSIGWDSDCRYWKWVSIKNPISCKDLDVAQLIEVCWFKIDGKYDTNKLTKGVKYEVYFCVELKDNLCMNGPVTLKLTRPDGTTEEHKEELQNKPKNTWVGLKAGEFSNTCTCGTDVEFSIKGSDGTTWKTGLTIIGAAIMPIC